MSPLGPSDPPARIPRSNFTAVRLPTHQSTSSSIQPDCVGTEAAARYNQTLLEALESLTDSLARKSVGVAWVLGEVWSVLGDNESVQLPVVRGVIQRRLLVNYRVRPEALRRLLPPAF